MRGELPGGWRNDDVKEALDLCLACKGCKHECPVRVDMATYKAEFLSHYYAGRLRPRQDYLLGLIYWEARLASHFPRAANALARVKLGRRLAGLTPHRRPPQFATRSFKAWFRDRGGTRNPYGRPVLVWPDTFNNYFHPEVAIAATEVLEAAGYQVRVPGRSLCCGRPLYDYGMLTLAERQLRQLLDALRDEIRAGTPVVAIEPSCGAVLRDELLNMLPHDEDAKRLAKQTHTLGEFLANAEDWEAPRLARKAIVHFHCHQRATSDVDCDKRVLDKLGLDYEVLESGCCGLAGSFGYEAGERYEVSMKAGEQVLLPRVRETPEKTVVVTDGFSCRSQIEHGANGRRSLHLAELIALALRENGTLARETVATNGHRRTALPALLAAGVAAGTGAVLLSRRR
jgi:Fe-S oxidoreductase